MKYLFFIFGTAWFFVSCNSSTGEHSERVKSMIMQSKLAGDPHTWSRPNDARVTHLSWDADIDMEAHQIRATASYHVLNLKDTSVVILDVRDLNIEEVRVNNMPVAYLLGPAKSFIGQPLEIPIPPDSCEISIRYSTAPEAAALLWVDGERPFLFTQSQAILARTWIPCQDSPGVRFTYDARVKVPDGLLALMSAENPQQKLSGGQYSFRMNQPVPSYLMALAVGDIEFREIGPRTGVYATSEVIDKAAVEFSEMESLVEAAENLYGPYVWGRYDLLVLPAAFPFGGMENPRLTFATPTILAGDKSLVSLVAHELAHSWSGNLVTNSTWNDFWLNEGFTVYFEMRIMEAVYGKERSEMLAQLARQDLDFTLTELTGPDTHLKLALNGRDPDEGMSDIAYNKGYFFLRLIEESVGRDKFDVFLKNYFTSHAFEVMDTEAFVEYLRANLLSDEEMKTLRVDEWIYGPGLPSNAPVVHSDPLVKVDEKAAEWMKLKTPDRVPWDVWSYQERYRFLSAISDYSADDMAALDKAFSITQTGNSEVLFKWLENSIHHHYTNAYPRLEEFLLEVGRRKFVRPLYKAMIESGQREMALRIYSKAKPNYHSVTRESVDEDMGLSEGAK
jgi:leukotriene-A4 hydrolase